MENLHEYTAIITIIGVFIANAALILPLWLWNRSESRSDIRNIDSKIESNRQETNAILQAIRDDIKDFHGRLCAIEERNRK